MYTNEDTSHFSCHLQSASAREFVTQLALLLIFQLKPVIDAVTYQSWGHGVMGSKIHPPFPEYKLMLKQRLIWNRLTETFSRTVYPQDKESSPQQ